MAATRRHSRYPLAWLLALALVLGALVPTGWMPMSGSHGPALTLCTAQGPVHLPGPGSDHGPSPAHTMPCAFAGIAALALPPVAWAPAATPTWVDVALPPVSAVHAGKGIGAPPRPATGPPLSA